MKVFKPGDLVRKIRHVPDLLRRERDVLIAMAECANSDGSSCYPGEKRLMSMCGYKKRDTVSYALSGLRKKALILRDGKHGYTDKYQLNIPGMLNYVSVSDLKQDNRGDYLTPERLPAIVPKQQEKPNEKVLPVAKKYYGVNITNQLPGAAPTETNKPRQWKVNQPGLHTDGWVPPHITYPQPDGKQEEVTLSEDEQKQRWLRNLRMLHSAGLSPDRLQQYAARHQIPSYLVDEVVHFGLTTT